MKYILRQINLWFLLLFAFLLFPLRFSVAPNLTFIFIYIVPMFYLIIKRKWLSNCLARLIHIKCNYLVVTFCILSSISFFWPIGYNTFDFSFFEDYTIRFLLLSIKSLFLLIVYERYVKKTEIPVADFVTYYILSVCLYVLFSCLILSFNGFREICIDFLYLTQKNMVDIKHPMNYTRFGWSGWSGFDETMRCSVGFLLSCFLMVTAKVKEKQKFYFFTAIICLLGNILYGRTGTIVSLVIYFFTICICVIKKRMFFVKYTFFSIMLLTSILFVISFKIPESKVWFNWAFSIFSNIIEKGEFYDNTGSVGVLRNRMYWLPNWQTFLIGNGWYTFNGSYYMNTDSGIMRPILFYGIVYYLISLIVSIMFCCKISKICQKQLGSSLVTCIYMILSVFSLIILFELKGGAYYKIVSIFLPIIIINKTYFLQYSTDFKRKCRSVL